MRKIGLLWLALLIAVMLAPALVSAQPDDALDTVTQALDNLAALEGYHFTAETRVNTEISSEDNTVVNAAEYSSEGDALQNGDNQTTIAVSTELEGQMVNPPLELNRIVADGTVYTNFNLEDTGYETLLDIASGWWRYDDLRDSLDSEATAAGLDSFVKLPLPAQITALRPDFVTSVVEDEPVTLDGRALRVFDVELDALQIVLEQEAAAQSGGTDLSDLMRAIGVLKSGELTSTLRLWIGEDGQLYRIEGASVTELPYLSTGNEDITPFDIRTASDFTITLSEHGKTAEIEAPFPVNE